ncbi:hypothetical protein WKR98_10030 [Pigmentiphaga sp. YJ18]|uniref:hypothetical protein n=1 Tax=Pigmentiphaga sp. YJ18 TaxID=3134907 RepID=UPI003118E4C1
MTLFYAIAWAALLWIALRSRSRYLFFFVVCQFVFVGLGLTIFPFFGLDKLAESFSTFRVELLSEGDFYKANAIVLVGSWVAVILNRLLRQPDLSTMNAHRRQLVLQSGVRRPLYFVCSFVAISACTFFIIQNFSSYKSLITAANPDALTDFVELRYEAISNYLIILIVYNFAPAVSIVALLRYTSGKTKLSLIFFAIFFVITSLALIFTFQKRPLMVYLGGCAIAWVLYERYRRGHEIRIDYANLLAKKWIYLPVALGVVFFFYYFQTAYRFYMSFWDTVPLLFEVIVTRVIGRLSLPAAMYVDYFPSVAPHYWLSNVGLFGSLLGFDVFEDSRVVFSSYAVGAQSGSVAASVFIDAYGQGGVIVAILYGAVVALIISWFDVMTTRAPQGMSRVYVMIFGMVFLYYLSQASLFRSALGYGGVFYFLVWLLCFKKKIRYSGNF